MLPPPPYLIATIFTSFMVTVTNWNSYGPLVNLFIVCAATLECHPLKVWDVCLFGSLQRPQKPKTVPGMQEVLNK